MIKVVSWGVCSYTKSGFLDRYMPNTLQTKLQNTYIVKQNFIELLSTPASFKSFKDNCALIHSYITNQVFSLRPLGLHKLKRN